jgi:hypothetical protein
MLGYRSRHDWLNTNEAISKAGVEASELGPDRVAANHSVPRLTQDRGILPNPNITGEHTYNPHFHVPYIHGIGQCNDVVCQVPRELNFLISNLSRTTMSEKPNIC